MRLYLSAAVAAAVASTFSAPARADLDFGYVYTTDVEEPGETELSLWATDRRGKAGGHYDAQDYRLEVERGIAEHFQASVYANFSGHNVGPLGGEFAPVHRDLAFQGLEAEFKYELLDPARHNVGIAFYAEPGWSRIEGVKGSHARELELELKAIVQKNFLKDRLVWATNFTLEPEWEREHEETAPGMVTETREEELGAEVATGLAYRATSRLWVGLEGRYHSVYPNWTAGLHRENYAVYAGPTVHYDGGKWSVTASFQPQLFGGPGEGGSSLELEDHEKRELRMKLSYEF